MQGSSTIFKSGGINITAMRDKLSDDPVERNTTRIVINKARSTGITGPAGSIYYDNLTHTLYDLEEYLEKHPELVSTDETDDEDIIESVTEDICDKKIDDTSSVTLMYDNDEDEPFAIRG